MKDETVNVEHRPLGRIGGALFCFSIFITSFYGAIFILGPCFALIYIWPWLYRRVVDRIVAFWLIFPIGRFFLFSSMSSKYYCSHIIFSFAWKGLSRQILRQGRWLQLYGTYCNNYESSNSRRLDAFLALSFPLCSATKTQDCLKIRPEIHPRSWMVSHWF